jgi:isoquinoline 1-oxidoreductase subunit alpha
VIAISVNGARRDVDVPPDTPLLWALRDTLGLTGTKYGCGVGQCGACTVLVDGAAARSCVLPVSSLAGRRVTTIEGLSARGDHPVQRAWVAEDVAQCGYCQPGMILAVVSLLRERPRPTDADIDTRVTNVCRCGTYARVRAAVHRATRER